MLCLCRRGTSSPLTKASRGRQFCIAVHVLSMMMTMVSIPIVGANHGRREQRQSNWYLAGCGLNNFSQNVYLPSLAGCSGSARGACTTSSPRSSPPSTSSAWPSASSCTSRCAALGFITSFIKSFRLILKSCTRSIADISQDLLRQQTSQLRISRPHSQKPWPSIALQGSLNVYCVVCKKHRGAWLPSLETLSTIPAYS